MQWCFLLTTVPSTLLHFSSFFIHLKPLWYHTQFWALHLSYIHSLCDFQSGPQNCSHQGQPWPSGSQISLTTLAAKDTLDVVVFLKKIGAGSGKSWVLQLSWKHLMSDTSSLCIMYFLKMCVCVKALDIVTVLLRDDGIFNKYSLVGRSYVLHSASWQQWGK